MFRLFFIIIIFLITSFSQLSAQYDKSKSDVFEDRFLTSFGTKPSLDVKFDSRFSFIRNVNVKTFGMKVGLNFNHRFKLGLGANSMITASTTKIANLDDTVAVSIDYSYWSPYMEYVYYSSKKWEFSLMVQLGVGEAKYSFRDIYGELKSGFNTFIITYEPAMQIDYRIIPWVALGTGIGYKMELYRNNGGVTEPLSSPQFILKLKVYLGKIYRTIIGRKMPIPLD